MPDFLFRYRYDSFSPENAHWLRVIFYCALCFSTAASLHSIHLKPLEKPFYIDCICVTTHIRHVVAVKEAGWSEVSGERVSWGGPYPIGSLASLEGSLSKAQPPIRSLTPYILEGNIHPH